LLLFFVLSCDTLIHYRVRLVFDRLTAKNTEGSH
jgi:simple sugar transport system permease protein